MLRAQHLHDGYFFVMLPYVSGVSVKMLLGEHYEWLQIEKVQLLNHAGSVRSDVSNALDLKEIDRTGEIYRCQSEASIATIRPVDLPQFPTPHFYNIVFRPLVLRAHRALLA